MWTLYYWKDIESQQRMPRTSIEVRRREKKKVIYTGKPISISSDFSARKKKKLNPELLQGQALLKLTGNRPVQLQWVNLVWRWAALYFIWEVNQFGEAFTVTPLWWMPQSRSLMLHLPLKADVITQKDQYSKLFIWC